MSLEWKDVHQAALRAQQRIRAERPYLLVPEAMKEAWRDPQVQEILRRYHEQQRDKPRKKKSKQ